jgi:hypothetical protein
MILGPMALFLASCENFLVLAGLVSGLEFRFRACIVGP